MSAGLPGLGLGGLFFILSALVAPFPELWRTLGGRSSAETWRRVGRQFAQALLMIFAVDLTLRGAFAVLSLLGLSDGVDADGVTVLPLVPIAITAGLLATVLCVAKLADLALRARRPALPALPAALPRPAPLRVLAVGGAGAALWFALLAFGASELSPLSDPSGGSLRGEPPAVASAPPSEEDEGEQSADVPSSADLGESPAAFGREARDRRPAGTDGGRDPQSSPGGEGSPVPGGPGTTVEAAPGPVTPGTSAPVTQPAAVPAAPAGQGPGSGQGLGQGQGSGGQGGPPETAGPKEGSRAPEHAGPPEHVGARQAADGG
jgi:hypothetical protein